MSSHVHLNHNIDFALEKRFCGTQIQIFRSNEFSIKLYFFKKTNLFLILFLKSTSMSSENHSLWFKRFWSKLEKTMLTSVVIWHESLNFQRCRRQWRYWWRAKNKTFLVDKCMTIYLFQKSSANAKNVSLSDQLQSKSWFYRAYSVYLWTALLRSNKV